MPFYRLHICEILIINGAGRVSEFTLRASWAFDTLIKSLLLLLLSSLLLL